jgi:hypothetical protein
MLHRPMPYMLLLRAAGILLILLALFQIYSVASRPFALTGLAQTRPLILVDPAEAVVEMLYAEVFQMLGVAILFLSIVSLRVKLAYWSLQLAVWLGGISLWYQQSTNWRATPIAGLSWPASPWPWLMLTLLCSLAILVFHQLVEHALLALMKAGERQEPAGKDETKKL